MQKIILKKDRNKIKIVLVKKHKVKDILGIQNSKSEILFDIKKFINYVNNGIYISKNAFDFIYKILVNELINEKIIIVK